MFEHWLPNKKMASETEMNENMAKFNKIKMTSKDTENKKRKREK
jgi:hypothetical protein